MKEGIKSPDLDKKILKTVVPSDDLTFIDHPSQSKENFRSDFKVDSVSLLDAEIKSNVKVSSSQETLNDLPCDEKIPEKHFKDININEKSSEDYSEIVVDLIQHKIFYSRPDK